MWIVETLLVVGAILFITLFARKLERKLDKKNKENNDIASRRIDKEMSNMNFQQGREYVLKLKKEKSDDTKKRMIKVVLIALALTVVMAILGRKMRSIADFLTVWLEVAMAISMLLLTFKKGKYDEKYAKDVLNNIYEKEICEPILDKHNYHNVKYGIAKIPDTEMGLARGDRYSDIYNCITCDEFTYRNVRYYHTEETVDKDGNTHTEYVTTFEGSELFISCETKIEEDVRIIPSITKNNGKENIYISKGKQLGDEHVDIEDIKFNEEFEVYSKNPHFAFLFLNSQRIEYLKQLREKYIISLIVTKEGLYIATTRMSSCFELPYLETADNPEQIFEDRLKNFEAMLEEFKKIL